MISDVQPLGLSPDEPGSMYLDGQTLRVSPRLPREYDSVGFRVRAPREALLLIELAPQGEGGSGHEVVIPVADLIQDAHSSLLDDRGNQLRVRRAPGDQMRVRLERDALVFRGGERFEFWVTPHLLDVEPGSTLSCETVLRDAHGTDGLWDETREVQFDAQGRAEELGPISVPLPDRDGVFQVVITLNRRRLPTLFGPVKVISQREVQVAVLSATAPTAETGTWKPLADIIPQSTEVNAARDGSRSRLWTPLQKLPSWWWLPGSAGGEKPPLGNGKTRSSSQLEGFVELQAGGWQAYPLPVGTVGQPHAVELEYAADVVQGLNVRILEANAAGFVTPFGPNAGLDVAARSGKGTSRIKRHQMVYWPRSQTVLLLVSNTRPDASAHYGRMRVFSGPRRLPVPATPAAGDKRLLAALYDRPLFPEEFSAPEAMDTSTGRSLNDWVTFQEGTLRLADYLRYAGYNGAMVSALHDGGTLWPSRLLEPTPRYENGIFFATGQDPIRKDVLELMFRIFDRQAMQLVPMLQFSTPLPELEVQLRAQPEAATTVGDLDMPPRDPVGIELVGSDGNTWRATAGGGRPSGPYYNPLDPRVQQAVRRIVVELVDRYGDHPSFGGVAIRLGPDTYSQLPDLHWGVDRQTLGRFAKESGLTLPRAAAADPRQLATWLSEAADGGGWAEWRAAKLSEFYHTLQADVTDRVPRARVYLAGADMLNGAGIRADLHPRLPDRLDLRELMVRVGIDPLRYADSGNLLLLRPERVAPLITLEEQAVNLQLRDSPEIDPLYGAATVTATDAGRLRPLTGGLFYHEPQTLVPDSFSVTSPFGPDKTSAWFLVQATPTGDLSRRRFVHSLASLDSQVVVDGGWVAGQGTLADVSAFAAAYRELPAARFETVPSRAARAGEQPVVVRRLSAGHRTYFYIANDSPWPVSVALDLDDRRPFNLEVLGGRQLPPVTRSGQGVSWKVALQPYDLIAASLSAPDVKIRDWRVALENEREVLLELRQLLDDARKRARKLGSPQPLPVLANPGFETPASGELLSGWECSRGAGTAVTVDSRSPYNGRNSLHIQSDGPPVWVRSNPFPTPATGRLAVWVWLKVADADRQPPLQLAIEGRWNGEPYYRPARLGATAAPGRAAPPPITAEWEPYVVRVDNLPPSATDLRVAVDLLGEGEVWVDEVQVQDLYFDPSECNELTKLFALANLYLGKGAAVDCERLVRGYWAEFLRTHVPLDEPQSQFADRDAAGNRPDQPEGGKDGSAEPAASTSWLQRIVPKPPKLPKLLR